jgi:hypothetical protein
MLSLAFPEDLPKSADAFRQHASDVARRALASRSWRPRPMSTDGLGLLAAIRDTVDAWPRAESAPSAPRTPGATADPDAHDAYCRIERTKDAGLHVLVGAILQSYEESLHDVLSGGSSLSSREWMALPYALESLLDYIRRHVIDDGDAGDVPRLAVAYDDAVTADPLERWIVGHHVFLVLIQGLIVSLNCFQSTHAGHDAAGAEEALDLAAVLMNGASTALRCAGDFPRSSYDATVRPTMMPPHVPPGMSGVLARDHTHLVKTLHGQRASFAALEPPLSAAYERFAAAFAETYDCHKLVCAHFGGGERASLLNGDAPETGIEALEAMKQTRLKAFVPRGTCPMA